MGGGDKNQNTQAVQQAVYQALQGPPVTTVTLPRYMPGQQEMMADQLSTFGYAAPQHSIAAWNGLLQQPPAPIANAGLLGLLQQSQNTQPEDDGMLRNTVFGR